MAGDVDIKRKRAASGTPRVPSVKKVRKLGSGISHGDRVTDRVNNVRAKALKDRGTKSIVTVQTSFGGRLAKYRTPGPVRAWFRERIDSFVQYTSERLVVFSLVLNEAVRTCMDRGEEPPDLSSNNMQKLLAGNGDPRVQEVWAKWHAELPSSCTDDAPVRVSHVLQNAANAYAVNHAYTIVANYTGRLVRFITGYIRLHAPRLLDERGMWYWVYATVMGVERREEGPMTREATALVDLLREHGQGTINMIVHNNGRSKHDATDALRRSHKLLGLHLQHAVPKAFALVPMNNVKRHHITIDTTTMMDLVRGAARAFGGAAPKWVRRVAQAAPGEATSGYAWRHFFCLKDLRSWRRYAFHGSITTNGISASVKFTEPKRPEPRSNEDLKAGVLEIAGRRDIFIDPGRVNMILALEVLPDETERWYTLTKHEYQASYQRGLSMLKVLTEDLRDVDAEFAQTSYKSTLPTHDAYMRTYIKHYARLWKSRGGRRYARTTFYVTICKRRALDRFFATFFQKGQVRPTVWYGAGSFGTHTRGSDGMAVPTKYVLAACKRMHTTVMVDEYMTSQMHSRCQVRMDIVRTRRIIGPEERWGCRRREIRGLFWCVECKEFVNRDRDACRSIRHAALVMERPGYLRRNIIRRTRVGSDRLPPRRQY
jgi:hypothetical protein